MDIVDRKMCKNKIKDKIEIQENQNVKQVCI